MDYDILNLKKYSAELLQKSLAIVLQLLTTLEFDTPEQEADAEMLISAIDLFLQYGEFPNKMAVKLGKEVLSYLNSMAEEIASNDKNASALMFAVASELQKCMQPAAFIAMAEYN